MCFSSPHFRHMKPNLWRRSDSHPERFTLEIFLTRGNKVDDLLCLDLNYESYCDTDASDISLWFLPLNHIWIQSLQREESSHTHTHTDTLTPETCLPRQSRTVSHWAVLLEQSEVQCLAQGHFSSSSWCCYCGTEMCFSFSFLTEIFLFFLCVYFPTCPGIVTCDHLVTNSEPLGYSCPHDARLVLSGTMLHQEQKKKTHIISTIHK